MKKILIVSDAWEPQVNGVATTLKHLVKELKSQGHTVDLVSTNDAKIKIPTPYPDVYIAFGGKKPKDVVPHYDYLHIATPEGSVGKKYLNYAIKNKLKFTTGYHTKWPEFLHAMYKIPMKLTYWYMRKLHKHSSAVLVPTQTAGTELAQQGFKNAVTWTRGVDRDQFTLNLFPDNYIVCVSIVSKEKNLDDFCKLETGFDKVLVGDGPYLEELKKKYPYVTYTGVKHGKELAEYYSNAKCFVFPSKSDTFGVVMIESMACGTPVAAYPVTGPLDVIDFGKTGYMSDSLEDAVDKCLDLNRSLVWEYSKKWTWEESANQFRKSLIKINYHTSKPQ